MNYRLVSATKRDILKLIEYKLIEKDGKDYVVTSKGLKYYEAL